MHLDSLLSRSVCLYTYLQMIDSLRYNAESAVSFLLREVDEVGVTRMEHDRASVLSREG